ncbi:unnamed protein product [Nezara viridula]|uniref:Chitin-binding type-2 domain-containing protein n=1 Tax=Nezara viridula TaxID=85310 RepID=A0A9P0MY14_NEZVI|nr:unnamed protein product [Nezara viridula]
MMGTPTQSAPKYSEISNSCSRVKRSVQTEQSDIEVRSQCTGRVADPQQCDAYTDCINGSPEPAVCPDGLVFSPEANGYPCLYPQEVDCTGRPAIRKY